MSTQADNVSFILGKLRENAASDNANWDLPL